MILKPMTRCAMVLMDDEPDGSFDRVGDIIEFNVPNSKTNGDPRFSIADDQYPIKTNNPFPRFHYDSSTVGNDWAVFAVSPNSNTDKMPAIAQNGDFIRVAKEISFGIDTIRITGFGIDDDTLTKNNAQQTDTGNYLGETTSGSNVHHEYHVDTMRSNSGSPIIEDFWTNYSIGVHTNGGCDLDSEPPRGNIGTSFNHTTLANWLNNLFNNNTRYVDPVHWASSEDGTIFAPFDTFWEAVDDLPSGGVIFIMDRVYDETGTIDKEMTIYSPLGIAQIGQ